MANNFFHFISTITEEENKDFHFFDGKSALKLHVLPHSADQLAIYKFARDDFDLERFQTLIQASFPETPNMTIVVEKNGELEKANCGLEEIKEVGFGGNEFYLIFTPTREASSMDKFKELIAHLRAPEGCPWDRKQTHLTLRTNLIEEAYEVIEAIDEQKPSHLCEELGDLLLQIVLHAQIAAEKNEFTMDDVIDGVYKKIIKRHPHVFGNVEVNGAEEAIQSWEKIKEEERAANGNSGKEFHSILNSIPTALSSLSVAQKFQERASRVGFDWGKIEPVVEKIEEELDEVKAARSTEASEEELGDLLFAVVNLIRWKGLDAESALRKSNKKFQRRFEFVEKSLINNGRSLSGATLAEMDALWDLAKKNENKEGK